MKPHKTRHTNITEAARAKPNPRAVQTYACHADFSMTASYLRVTVHDEDVLGGAFAAAYARKKSR